MLLTNFGSFGAILYPSASANYVQYFLPSKRRRRAYFDAHWYVYLICELDSLLIIKCYLTSYLMHKWINKFIEKHL